MAQADRKPRLWALPRVACPKLGGVGSRLPVAASAEDEVLPDTRNRKGPEELHEE